MTHWIVAPVVLPAMLAAFIVLVVRFHINLARVFSVAGTLALLGISAGLAWQVSDGSVGLYQLGDWAAPFGIVLVADRLSTMMILLTSVLLIAVRATPWHTAGLLLLSLALMHAIVFQVGFAGQEEADQPVTAFFHFTLAGYGLVLLVSLFMLWIFGRTEGQALSEIVSMVVVLGFPAALGAAAARLLV